MFKYVNECDIVGNTHNSSVNVEYFYAINQ